MASSRTEDAVRNCDNGGGDGGTEIPPSTIGHHRTNLLGAITRGNVERIHEVLASIAPDDLTELCSDHLKGQLSVLHAAVETGNIELVQILLDKGFVASSTDQKGRRPVDIARAANNEDMVRVLNSSCEVNETDGTKDNIRVVHKKSADSGVSSSSENPSTGELCNGDSKATDIPSPTDAIMTVPVNPADMGMPATASNTEGSDAVDAPTREAVFNFLKRRLSNNKWKEFFKVLGFSQKDVMELKFHYINISLEECIAQGLVAWYKKDGDFGRLFGALCHGKVNQRILVDDLKRRFTRLRPIAIRPIRTEDAFQEEMQALSGTDRNGVNGREERSNSGPEHTPSQSRKKIGLFDKISSSVRKFSTTTSHDDSVLTEPKKVRKGRRFSVDESRKMYGRGSDAGLRRGSYDDKVNKTYSPTNEPLEKLSFLNDIKEDVPTVDDKTSQKQSLQVVEADVHTESTTTDESGRQSLASTPRMKRSGDDTSLVIHESGSEGSITPRSPSSPRSKKKHRDSGGSFKFRNISIPSPSIFRKKYKPPSSPSPKLKSPKSPQKNKQRRRKVGHVTCSPDDLKKNELIDNNDSAGFFLLPSAERYCNEHLTSSETSDDTSDRQSSRKDSSETHVSVQTEISSEFNQEGAIEDIVVDEATRHLLDAGKSIELLLSSLITQNTNNEYKTTTVDTSSRSVVVELVNKTPSVTIDPHRPVGRQRSYSDSEVKVQRIFTTTKSGTYRMDFYFRQRDNSTKSLNLDMPQIRQKPLRRHSEQTYPTTENYFDPVWEPRKTKGRKRVTVTGVGQHPGDRHQETRFDLSTTM